MLTNLTPLSNKGHLPNCRTDRASATIAAAISESNKALY